MGRLRRQGKNKEKKQSKSSGKSPWDKAVGCAKKMVRLDEQHTPGHALYARSALCLMEAADGMKDKTAETAEAKADALKTEGAILRACTTSRCCTAGAVPGGRGRRRLLRQGHWRRTKPRR